MKNFFCSLMTLLAAFLVLANSSSIAEAKIYKGMAAIDGDEIKAQRLAREDAMRNAIEEALGTRVNSQTEVSMGMVVSDKIMLNADGYVRPVGEPKFTANAGVMICEINLEVSTQRIVQEGDNVKSMIQNAINADTTGRSHVVIAVSGRDENGNLHNDSNTTLIENYLGNVMSLQGFSISDSGEIVEYLHRQDFDNPIARANARTQVRNMTSDLANAILRGSMTTRKVERSGSNYIAMVQVSFQLVGITSSEVNSFADFVTAVDSDRTMAIFKAQKLAAEKMSAEIAKRAAETLQGETKGGVQHTKIGIEIAGIVDRTAQGEKVLAAIRNANCRVIRSLYDKKDPTTLKVFVDATGAGSLDDIKANIKAQLPNNLEDGDENTDARGAAKIYLRYKG